MTDELLFEDSIDINMMLELHHNFLELLENDNKNELKIELPVENDYGFIEYKRNFLSYENAKMPKLRTQIYWRVSQGLKYNYQSSCYYLLGLEDDGNILKSITKKEFSKSIKILKKCLINSNINYYYKKIYYKTNFFFLIKFWKREILNNNEIKIMLLGETNTLKTKFFIDIHNTKFNVKENNKQKLFKKNIFDIHNDETEMQKTLTLHHQYIKINYDYETNNIFHNNEIDEKINIHIIDTPGNSIISNIRYLLSYNVDIIIYFNQKTDQKIQLYDDIIYKIKNKYNNVISITESSYLQNNDTTQIIKNAINLYDKKKHFLKDIYDVILINENKLIQSSIDVNFNKHIAFCFNFMKINLFDVVSNVKIRNIQYNYDYKSNIVSNNSISIESKNPICDYIIGNTQILKILEIDNLKINDTGDNILTFYIIIFNQIYILNAKNLPDKIIFDKIILIPKKFKKFPIFILFQKNNKYFMEIFMYKNL
jgi:hypothetical protein